jgi:hypothetical protein
MEKRLAVGVGLIAAALVCGSIASAATGSTPEPPTGAIHGSLVGYSPSILGSAVIRVKGSSLFVQPNAHGYYLLTGLAPGQHDVVVELTDKKKSFTQKVTVQKPAPGSKGGTLTTGINFYVEK